MLFNQHLKLEGRHALLSASKYSWVNYNNDEEGEDKIVGMIQSQIAAAKGTRLHNFAAEAIRLGQKLNDTQQTMNLYVNDAIGFRMTPEQTLYYSDNAFGTADAICFRDGVLRIHDLKTGTSPVKFTQLVVYAAFFCLEYDVKPGEIRIVLRIYQNDAMTEYEPSTVEVINVMSQIKHFDAIIERVKAEELALV